MRKSKSSGVRTLVANATSPFRTRWKLYWNALLKGVQVKLASVPCHYQAEPDLTLQIDAQSTHTRLFKWEPALFELLRRHLGIASTSFESANFEIVLD